MAIECPQCGLLSPPEAQRCDCGYDFVKRRPVAAQSMTLSSLLLSWEGRISRSTYWLRFAVPYLVIYMSLLTVDVVAGTSPPKAGMGVFSGIFTLLALYPSLAVGIKRCHDRDRSGWFMLVSVIPVVNLWVFVELGLLPGSTGANKYGPAPRRW
jgi:uncharacterized membrane protein YhaH (DUF805 family)